MPEWLTNVLEKSSYFMPHGHCYLWIPGLLWLHVFSDALIGTAYLGISLLLYLLVRKIHLPFSPVFIAFGLFIGLCGITHFMSVWTVWNPDYFADGIVKAATAAASVATAVGLLYVKPQIEEVVHAARLSEERRSRLETANAELEALYRKVTELNRLKTDFFANVSHELRTPLALMLGPAEQLLRDEALTAEQKHQLDLIVRNGRGLLSQVNDLLDVAKMEAGKLQLRYAEIDLAPWFRRVASQFELAAEQRGFRYRIVTPDTLRAQLDPDMIERVLINLLSNAFKFTPHGGEIEAMLELAGERIRLHVADTGPGITADQQRAVFERFHQVDAGATRQHGGTGLGLAIVKDIVELHGGTVDLHSDPGSGAKFVVHLPSRAPAAVQVRTADQVPAPATEAAMTAALQDLAVSAHVDDGETKAGSPNLPTVLIVEDNPEMRSFVASTLCGEFNTATATDGQEGYEHAMALRPDLIVTDLMMPGMSGDQLVKAIRQRNELDATPILLLSARADDEMRISVLERGAQDYVTKPFAPQELLARSRNLAAMKRSGDRLRNSLASASVDLEALAEELSIRHRQLQVALAGAEAAKEQAQRASEVKSQFLGMISHELRTPISTMSINAQILMRHANLPGALKDALKRLQGAIQQISTLIEGLLEYTRADSGKTNPRFEPVDMLSIANAAVEANIQHAPPGVTVRVVPPETGLSEVVSDPRLLRIILDNLVSNALKFTKHGTVSVRLVVHEDWRVFEVHDTGIGIHTNDLQRIFSPFEQLEPVKRKSIAGVGLGLALVKELIQVLHGRIEVESTPGAGTAFRLLLPVDPRQVTTPNRRSTGDVL
jgi:signal transduction histidine kinase